MSATYEGQVITERHRRAQVAVATRLTARLRAAWSFLDVADIDATRTLWLAVSADVLRDEHAESVARSDGYFSDFRRAEVGAPLATAPTTLELPTAAIVSLDVLGPVAIKQKIAAGIPPATAKTTAFSELARTAQLHVLDGGRATLERRTRSDRRALGYQRVTDGDPCYFCAMLASRGPVYSKNSFRNAKVHGGCGCTLEPVYSRDGAWAAVASQWSDLWETATKGLSGHDAVKAFRREYDTLAGKPYVTRPAPKLNQALVARAKKLQQLAQEAFKRGDNAERLRLQAEASALWRRIYAEAGIGLADAA
jgi:hypothetical protein